MMRCDFCGYEYNEDEAKHGCGSCPMGAGCKTIKCPRCNYERPMEPVLIQKIKKFFLGQ